jgi:tRNA pseudouridine13 synthase
MIPPLLTAESPGIGGRLRAEPGDFIVEEIPLYAPLGVGDHLYCRIEKIGIGTREAVRRLARHLKVPEGRIGSAGLKDARAIARQTLSIEHVDPAAVEGLSLPGVRVLSAKRHRNKLRTGHLRGNRFEVRVRDVAPGAESLARAKLDVLMRRGLPNAFGPQRFGVTGRNQLIGAALLRDEPAEAAALLLGRPTDAEGDPRVAEARALYDAGNFAGALLAFPPSYGDERRCLERLARGADVASALRSLPGAARRFLVHATQAALFNEVLAERLLTLDTVEEGDLAWIHGKGAVFLVEDVDAERSRCDAFEISPSGPLFGTRMVAPKGIPAALEAAVLARSGLTAERFDVAGVGTFEGERRPLRVPVEDLEVRTEADGALLLAFSLPRGSYATALLAEVTGAPPEDLPEAG